MFKIKCVQSIDYFERIKKKFCFNYYCIFDKRRSNSSRLYGCTASRSQIRILCNILFNNEQNFKQSGSDCDDM